MKHTVVISLVDTVHEFPKGEIGLEVACEKCGLIVRIRPDDVGLVSDKNMVNMNLKGGYDHDTGRSEQMRCQKRPC